MRISPTVLIAASLASTIVLVASERRTPGEGQPQRAGAPAPAATRDVIVSEGTSMSVAVSPDRPAPRR